MLFSRNDRQRTNSVVHAKLGKATNLLLETSDTPRPKIISLSVHGVASPVVAHGKLLCLILIGRNTMERLLVVKGWQK